MRVLLTGGSGFVGGALARHLVERGHTVTALVRRTSRTDALCALGVSLVEGDLATGQGLDRAMEGIDVVQHFAGVTKASTDALGFQPVYPLASGLAHTVAWYRQQGMV